jgi:hypothetical protein
VLGGATARLSRVRLESPFGSGMFVGQPGSSAVVEDLLVRDVQPLAEAPLGRGISVEEGATLGAARVLVERASEIALFASSAAVTLTDVTLRDTRSTAEGVFGRGLQVQLGAQVAAERLRVEAAREAGIVAAGAGTLARLRDVVVDGTLERECVTTTCPGLGGGIGLGAYLEGAAVLEAFSIRTSALVAVQIARDGSIDLHEGTVRECPIGVNLQVPDYDVTRLTDRVAFVATGVALASDALPVPDVGP